MIEAEEFLRAHGAFLEPRSRALMVAMSLRRGLTVEVVAEKSRIFISDGQHRFSFNQGQTSFNSVLARRICRHHDVVSKLLRAGGISMVESGLFTPDEAERAWAWARSMLPVAIGRAGSEPSARRIDTVAHFTEQFQIAEGPVVVEADPRGKRTWVLVVDGEVKGTAQADSEVHVGELAAEICQAALDAVVLVPGLRVAEVELAEAPHPAGPIVTRISARVDIARYATRQDPLAGARALLDAMFPVGA